MSGHYAYASPQARGHTNAAAHPTTQSSGGSSTAHLHHYASGPVGAASSSTIPMLGLGNAREMSLGLDVLLGAGSTPSSLGGMSMGGLGGIGSMSAGGSSGNLLAVAAAEDATHDLSFDYSASGPEGQGNDGQGGAGQQQGETCTPAQAQAELGAMLASLQRGTSHGGNMGMGMGMGMAPSSNIGTFGQPPLHPLNPMDAAHVEYDTNASANAAATAAAATAAASASARARPSSPEGFTNPMEDSPNSSADGHDSGSGTLGGGHGLSFPSMTRGASNIQAALEELHSQERARNAQYLVSGHYSQQHNAHSTASNMMGGVHTSRLQQLPMPLGSAARFKTSYSQSQSQPQSQWSEGDYASEAGGPSQQSIDNSQTQDGHPDGFHLEYDDSKYSHPAYAAAAQQQLQQQQQQHLAHQSAVSSALQTNTLSPPPLPTGHLYGSSSSSSSHLPHHRAVPAVVEADEVAESDGDGAAHTHGSSGGDANRKHSDTMLAMADGAFLTHMQAQQQQQSRLGASSNAQLYSPHHHNNLTPPSAGPSANGRAPSRSPPGDHGRTQPAQAQSQQQPQQQHPSGTLSHSRIHSLPHQHISPQPSPRELQLRPSQQQALAHSEMQALQHQREAVAKAAAVAEMHAHSHTRGQYVSPTHAASVASSSSGGSALSSASSASSAAAAAAAALDMPILSPSFGKSFSQDPVHSMHAARAAAAAAAASSAAASAAASQESYYAHAHAHSQDTTEGGWGIAACNGGRPVYGAQSQPAGDATDMHLLAASSGSYPGMYSASAVSSGGSTPLRGPRALYRQGHPGAPNLSDMHHLQLLHVPPSGPTTLLPLCPIGAVGTPGASPTASFDRIGAYTREERARRVARFHEKRLRRCFKPRVLYQVRKDFAVSRRRVGGRFIKKQNPGCPCADYCLPGCVNYKPEFSEAALTAAAAAAGGVKKEGSNSRKK